MGKSRGTDGVIRDCLIQEHAGYGAICLACAIEMGREERAYEREACAKVAESTGLKIGHHVAQKIREQEAIGIDVTHTPRPPLAARRTSSKPTRLIRGVSLTDTPAGSKERAR